VAAIEPYTGVLMALVIAATVALALLYAADIDRLGLMSLRESAFYLQKMALSLLLLGLMHRVATGNGIGWWILDRAGTWSFGLYFLHGPLERLTTALMRPWLPVAPSVGIQFLLIVSIFLVACLLSAVLIVASQRLVGKRSRYLIGC
jgi:peptidoglycan/LPS O-acetylase OafA/YrhL